MKSLLHIIRYEWKMLWRSHLVEVILLVVLGAGIYGIFFGKFELDKQRERIALVQEREREQFDSLLYQAGLDTTVAGNKALYQQAVSPTGVGWNKHFTYYSTHDAPPFAGLCLGQRDLYPVYYGFNVSDLARQLNVGELANPMKLLTGNFDLSYVFVFLFPLVIIALFYNLYAREQEDGTLLLLQAQATPLLTILLGKGIFRLVLVLGLATFLLFAAFYLQGISFWEHGQITVQLLAIIYGYCLFWVAIMTALIWLRRRADLTAIMGLGIWLGFTLIMPALLNLVVSAKAPAPNRSVLTHEIRTLNGENWEAPKAAVLQRFNELYPDYQATDTTNFDQWYYASFTLLDEKANTLNTQFEAQVQERQALIDRWDWLAPAALVHERLSALAGTDRDSHLRFVRDTHAYHHELKRLYYKRIYAGEQFSMQDLKALQQQL